MENRVSYILTGLFVIALTAAALGFGLWLASDIHTTRYRPYQTHFHESVSGLNLNSPVKYRGVEVGRVREMALDPDNPTRVRVLMDIAEGTPVRTDTWAMLRQQGLTGIAYVELGGGERGRPLPSPLPGGGIPEIPSHPSLFNRLDVALSRVADTVGTLGERLDRLLAEDNLTALRHTLAHLDEVSATLSADRAHIDAILRHTDRLTARLADTSRDLPALVGEFRRVLAHYDRLSDQLSATADTVAEMAHNVEDTVGGARQDLRGMARGLEAEVRRLAREVARGAREVSALTRKLNENPNALIFGTPRPPPGPGESE